MMYYAELADHDGPSNTARTTNNRNRRSSSGVTTSTISLDLDDLVGSSTESLDSLCGSFGGGNNKMMMNGGGSYFNKGIRRVSKTNSNSHNNNSSFFDFGDDFDFNETDDEDDDDDDNNNEDKVDDNNMKKLHDQIQRLDDSKLSKKALSFATHKRMSMSENWAYDYQNQNNNSNSPSRTRKVQFSNNEPEIIFIDKAFPEDYHCLYYDEMELQRMFDEFRIEEREARRHSLR